MALLINFLIAIIIFVIAAYGLFWICEKSKMPQPVYWLVGGFLIIIILLFISNQMGVGSGHSWDLFPRR